MEVLMRILVVLALAAAGMICWLLICAVFACLFGHRWKKEDY